MTNARGHSWRFKTRFRRHAFGWKSQPAITGLQEALSEIKQVARLEPVLAAEGAIALLERISPALEHVDSSSGAIGGAVNRTVAELVPIIARDFADKNPAFAVEAGLAALRWLVQGYGYEITSADVWAAYSHTIKAAATVDGGHDIRRRILALIDSADARGGFVARIIGRELGLP